MTSEVTGMSAKLNKKAIVIIVAVIAAIAIVGGSLAWFVTQSSLSQKFSISGISASADVYFDNNGTKTNASNYADKDGLYVLSLKKGDANYIGNLRTDINVTGKAVLRVRMNFEWTSANGAVAQYTSSIPFTFGDNWYDNRGTDYCIYYQGKNLSGKTDFDTTAFITGFDESKFDTFGFDEGTSVRLSIQVDAVQVNRYPQVWNIEKLPWK
jgi:flagellar basal body-associated protein FliL